MKRAGSVFFSFNLYTDVVDNLTVENSYLMVNWKVREMYQRSLTPVKYNISICLNTVPVACEHKLAMCSTTYYYNASTSSGKLEQP